MKKILYICTIVLILGAGGYAIYRMYFYVPTYKSNTGITVSQARDTTIDSDKDGLKDWEEVLWKTDPFNPDSDGDGTNDGEEVALNRDPTIKGPADAFEKTSATQNSTTKIAEQLLQTYLDNKSQDGSFVTTKDAKTLASEIIKKAYAQSKPAVYTPSNLKLIPNSLDNYKAYGNALADVFISFPQDNTDDIAIFSKALSTQQDSDLAPLDKNIKAYKEFLSNLLLTETPNSFSDVQIELINSTSSIIKNIEGMRRLIEDPAVSSVAVSELPANLQKFNKIIYAIVTQLKETGVEYSTDESGYGLLNIL